MLESPLDSVWTISGWCFGGELICIRCMEGVAKVFGWCLDSVLMMGYCLDVVWKEFGCYWNGVRTVFG